jgi:uncharacterized protein DUF2628
MTQCPSCGAGVEVAPGRCRKCGTSIAAPAAAPVVAVAGSGFSAAAAAPALARPSAPPSFAGLSNYYQQEFSQIYNSNEKYKGRFNWAAFLFGPLWALSKGLYVNAIIAILVTLATGGFLGLVVAGVYGARGNYFYYSQFVNGKQLAF